MILGAREARPSLPRRIVARAVARELAAFVVPGPDVARARGVDLEAAGLCVADTPRHADVLVLVGKLPGGLKRAAAVAYAQMPRPRAILTVGAGDVSPLPEPGISVAAEGGALDVGVRELRRSFAEGAFAGEAADFDVDEIRTQIEYVCTMHPEVLRDEPGSCPICGMDLVPREAARETDHGHSGHAHDRHEGMDHGAHDSHAEAGHDGYPDEDHGSHDEMAHEDMDHGEGSDGQNHGDHGGMEHGGHGDHRHMSHGDMGFMSMVEMTQDLPRSSDGLQMEWVNAPFGPLFPGLPGGLSLELTLDGDTVAGVEATPGVEGWGPEGLDGGSSRDLPDRLALLDPLSPVAYRVLAMKAVEDAAGAHADERMVLGRLGALERERAASHLGWLSGFGHLLGYLWLESRARRLQLALLRATDVGEVARLEPEVGKLLRSVAWTPLLRRRLKGIGSLPDDAETSGPVARAAGLAKDARREEDVYRSLAFEPVVSHGDDVLARLRVRLAEVEQSLGLVRKAGSVSVQETPVDVVSSDAGGATVETPRGTAKLRVTLEDGVINNFELDTPSTIHYKLIEAVVEQRELADALVSVASLDLSPWEVVR